MKVWSPPNLTPRLLHVWRFAVLLALVAVALAPPTGHTAPAPTAESSAGTPPNIVFILGDDQRWDTLWAMPTVQSSLIGRGMKFNNAFVVNSVCCPSRATILTGLYSHSTHVYHNINGEFGGFEAFDDSSTVATWLDDTYNTALIGKYLNGYNVKYVPPGWDRWVAFHKAPDYFNYTLNVDGTLRQYGAAEADYSTDVLGGFADDFIRTTPADQPLFLYFSPRAVHKPVVPAPRHADKFSDLPPYRPANYNEADVTDKPAWVRGLPLMSQSLKDKTDGLRRNQYRALLSVDDAVAQMLQALSDTGRLSNTMIVYSSDNGYSWGEHRWTGKLSAYEENIRVPMVIRYDPLTPNPVADGHTVTNLDLAPTWAELAGVAPPTVEGTSLMPLLERSNPAWRSDFLIEHLDAGASEEGAPIPTYCAMRTRRYSYVTYGTGEEELYNLATDKWQLTNVAADPGYASTLAQLRNRLKVLCDPPPPGFEFPY